MEFQWSRVTGSFKTRDTVSLCQRSDTAPTEASEVRAEGIPLSSIGEN
jgi:hypothetical protein